MIFNNCDQCKNYEKREGDSAAATLYGYCKAKKTGVNSFGKACSQFDEIESEGEKE